MHEIMHEAETKPWHALPNPTCASRPKDGTALSLGKNRKLAFDKFHQLRADRTLAKNEVVTIYALSQSYLDWCKANRKPNTYSRDKYFLRLFIASVGKRLRPAQLRRHHVPQMARRSWDRINDAVTIVQRMFNWPVAQEYLVRNPIAGMRKPPRKRSDVYYTRDQWKQIRQRANGSFGNILDFLYMTGCRPLEARTIEARHLHDDLLR